MISEDQVWKALPSSGFLRSYVEWASKWTGATPAFHMVAGLTLLAQSVPPWFYFPWQTPLRANLFGLLIGPSGAAGKGRAISMAKSVLTPAIETAEMEQPGSPEACLESLTPSHQILFYDEFGDFLQRTQMGQLAALRTTLTNLYDCTKTGHRLVKRKGKRDVKIEANPRLSLLAGGTPSFLEEFTTRTDWEGGFMSRFFIIHATSDRNPPTVYGGEPMREHLEKVLKSYHQRGLDQVDIFHDTPPKLKKCEGWAASAQSRWEEWLERLAALRSTESSLASGAIHRAAGHAAKIAILLAWDIGDARSGMPWEIGLETLEMSIRICELHVQSVLEIVGGLALNTDARDERSLYQAIGRNTPWAVALRNAGLSERRGRDMRASLIAKKMIRYTETKEGDEFFTRIEDKSNVIPFRSPDVAVSDIPPGTPIIRAEDLFRNDD